MFNIPIFICEVLNYVCDDDYNIDYCLSRFSVIILKPNVHYHAGASIPIPAGRIGRSLRPVKNRGGGFFKFCSG